MAGLGPLLGSSEMPEDRELRRQKIMAILGPNAVEDALGAAGPAGGLALAIRRLGPQIFRVLQGGRGAPGAPKTDLERYTEAMVGQQDVGGQRELLNAYTQGKGHVYSIHGADLSRNAKSLYAAQQMEKISKIMDIEKAVGIRAGTNPGDAAKQFLRARAKIIEMGPGAAETVHEWAKSKLDLGNILQKGWDPQALERLRDSLAEILQGQ